MDYDSAISIMAQIFTVSFVGGVFVILLAYLGEILERKDIKVKRYLDTIVSAGAASISTIVVNFINSLNPEQNIITFIIIYIATIIFISLKK